MITHAFDLVIINSWSEYKQYAERAKVPRIDHLDLLHLKMNMAHCLVRVQNMEDPACLLSQSMRNKHQYNQQAQDIRPLPEVQFDMLAYDNKKEAIMHKLYLRLLIFFKQRVVTPNPDFLYFITV